MNCRLFLLLLLPAWVFAADYLGVSKSEIERAIRESYNVSEKAAVRIESIIESSPESPIGYFLKASRLFALLEYAGVDNADKESFVEWSDRALEVAKKYGGKGEEKLRIEFIRAMTELLIGRYHIEEGNWLRAFFKANAGLRRIRGILKKNPDFHDAKLPLGLANCFLSKAPSYLKPFAFLMRFDGDMEKGLAQLADARDKGFISSFESSYYLVAVHWELRNDLDSVRVEIDRLVSSFPGNPEFQRLMGNLDLQDKRAAEAFERYEKLLRFSVLPRFPAIEVEARLKLGQHALNRNELSVAFDHGVKVEALCSSHDSLRKEKAWARLLQGETLRREKRFGEALAILKRIDKRDNSRAYDHARKAIKVIETVQSDTI